MSDADRSRESPTVDVFCSYARVDLAFARQVVDALRAAGKSVWVDLEGLYAGEQWWESIRTAVEASNAFVFIVSPASATSRQCHAEVEHAAARGKRIVPVLHRATTDEALPAAIASTQWLLDYANGGDAAGATAALVKVLDTDAAWVRAHTRWLQRAVEWDRASRPRELLMPAGALEEAERWLTAPVEREPRITDLQREYADVSRRGALMENARALGAKGGHDIEALEAAVRAVRDAGADPLGAPDLATLFDCTARARRAYPMRAHAALVTGVDITPDGTRALTGASDDFAALWDLTADPPRLVGRLMGASNYLPHAPRLSPDGGHALTWDGDTAWLWDARAAGLAHTIPLEGDVASLAFSPDGTLLIGARTAGATIWSVRDGDIVRTFDFGVDDYGFAAAVSPDNGTAVTVSSLYVRGWDVASGEQLYRLASGGRAAFRSAVFSPEGARLITSKDARVAHIRDARSGEEIARIQASKSDEAEGAWWVAEGLIALSISPHKLMLFREAGRERLAVPGEHDVIGAFAFSPDARSLATASSDRSGRVRLWSIARNELHETFTAHRDEVLALAWSSDGETLLTAGRDGSARLWQMSTLTTVEVLEPRAGEIRVARFERGDRSILLGCENGSVLRWRLDPTLEIDTLPGETWKVEATQAGDRVVVVPKDDRPTTVRLVDTADDAREIGSSRRIAFSPDGTHLAAIDADGVCRMYDTAMMEATWTVALDDDNVREILYAPDGGSLLLVARPALLLDSAGGSRVRAFGDETTHCEHAAFAPDARRLCLAETLFEVRGRVSRQIRRRARIIDLASGEEREISIDDDRDTPLGSIRFSPEGDVIVAIEGSSSVPWIIDATTAEPVRALGSMEDGRTSDAVFSPEGDRILTVAKQLTIWDRATGEPRLHVPSGDARRIVFSPDARTFATVGPHTVMLRDWPTCTLLAELADGVEEFPERVTFIDNGKRLVIVHGSGRAGILAASQDAVFGVAMKVLGLR